MCRLKGYDFPKSVTVSLNELQRGWDSNESIIDLESDWRFRIVYTGTKKHIMFSAYDIKNKYRLLYFEDLEDLNNELLISKLYT